MAGTDLVLDGVPEGRGVPIPSAGSRRRRSMPGCARRVKARSSGRVVGEAAGRGADLLGWADGGRAMRIIAGERRGHKFDGPRGRDTRPTSDLVRESIFNILRDEVEGRPVIDLFAGTGALGLEALSRGAEH